MKSILIIMLFFVGAVTAAPTEINDRAEYTSSLNSMASTVMNWYGSLIATNERVSFSITEQLWHDYRSSYPETITQIHITGTDLTKLATADQYQFKVNSLVNYKDSGADRSQLISETFIFHVPVYKKAIAKKISRDSTENTKTAHTSEFNRSYYKVREFAYAWLAYLDGVEMMESIIDTENWLDTASYSMKIGSNVIQGLVLSTLTKRKQYLAKGGHLLRLINVNEVPDKPHHFLLNLTIEWQGINQAGKPVLAKIHQEIEYTLLGNNSWDVISIKEQHLLPDIAPWQELLC